MVIFGIGQTGELGLKEPDRVTKTRAVGGKLQLGVTLSRLKAVWGGRGLATLLSSVPVGMERGQNLPERPRGEACWAEMLRAETEKRQQGRLPGALLPLPVDLTPSPGV